MLRSPSQNSACDSTDALIDGSKSLRDDFVGCQRNWDEHYEVDKLLSDQQGEIAKVARNPVLCLCHRQARKGGKGPEGELDWIPTRDWS